GGGRPAVAAVAGAADAGEGDDVARRPDDLADAAVMPVRDEEGAAAVPGHPVRLIQHGRGGPEVVAVLSRRAGAGDGEDGAGRLDVLADAVIALVGEEDVPAAVHGPGERVVQHGGGRRPAVAAVAGGAGAGDGDHGAGRLHHLADAIVIAVGDE